MSLEREEQPERWPLEFTVNGKPARLEIDPRRSLLSVLREELGLTGTKGACLEGECGSCSVLVDGKPMNSCLIMVGQMQGRSVTTIEGVSRDGQLGALQRKLLEHGAVQCGYCTPGFVVAAGAGLEQAGTSRQELLQALEGNICRCTGYTKIVDAVSDAADHANGEGGKPDA